MPRLEARIPRRAPEWMLRRLVVVPVVIALNVVVFGLWWAATAGGALERFLAENFVVSTLHLAQGRVWTLLTAEFSHIESWHLFLNMFVLWSFGSILERLWGRLRFVAFYLVAAAHVFLLIYAAPKLTTAKMERARAEALLRRAQEAVAGSADARGDAAEAARDALSETGVASLPPDDLGPPSEGA